MKNLTETDNAKNIANFNELVSNIVTYGDRYFPSKDTIKLINLQALSEKADDAMKKVNSTLAVFRVASVARGLYFEPLNSLTSRVLITLRAAATSGNIIDSAKIIIRKIHGQRQPATTKKAAHQLNKINNEVTASYNISTSQINYNSRLEYFEKLIQLLETIPNYSPTQDDIKASSLRTLLNAIKIKNDAAGVAEEALINARISRNELLYKPGTGMYTAALEIKSYVKSIYGSTSTQYKQIARLPFKTIAF